MALEREYSTLLTRWTRAAKTDYEFVERKLAEIASKRHSLRKKVYGQLPLHLADVERLAQFGIHDLADRLVDDSIYIDIVQLKYRIVRRCLPNDFIIHLCCFGWKHKT